MQFGQLKRRSFIILLVGAAARGAHATSDAARSRSALLRRDAGWTRNQLSIECGKDLARHLGRDDPGSFLCSRRRVAGFVRHRAHGVAEADGTNEPRAVRPPRSPTIRDLHGRLGAAACGRGPPPRRGSEQAPRSALSVGRMPGLAQGQDDSLARGEQEAAALGVTSRRT
jgi:hypothetical protein